MSVAKLRETFKGKDLSNCGWGRFWNPDGSPCCPLALLTILDGGWSCSAFIEANFGSLVLTHFPQTYDQFRDDGLTAEEAIDQTLTYLERLEAGNEE
jgi:hypothetical protein